MAINLQSFYDISNGSYNVGQIKLTDDENGLEKINNHVWKTSQNNVQTSAADNRKVRQALLDAFKADAQVPEALKWQIEYILLGEGRATRSLGRDFVKKLISTATDANNATGNIINAMETVEKRLRDRSVTRLKRPNEVPRELMTSTDDVSFEIYASEAMDRAAAKAHDGFVKIFRGVTNLAEGTVETFLGISELLQRDLRLVENPNILPLCNDLKSMARTFFIENKSVLQSLYGHDKAAALFERKVREHYNKHNVPADVCDDHFARIFTRPSLIPEGAEKLRKLFTDVSTGLIYGFEENEDKTNLAKLYLKFLGAMIDAVRTDSSLTQDVKRMALDRLNVLKGTVDQPSARMMEFQALGDKAYSLSNENNPKPLIGMVEAHLFKDIEDVFQGAPDNGFRVFNYQSSFARLGLGV